ncbi:MAG: GyrI-like domain-containing protein [Rhizobiales bacterium]|nr:GyrI-like domain-containing protein [Hyphomicrobiales bacterium]
MVANVNKPARLLASLALALSLSTGLSFAQTTPKPAAPAAPAIQSAPLPPPAAAPKPMQPGMTGMTGMSGMSGMTGAPAAATPPATSPTGMTGMTGMGGASGMSATPAQTPPAAAPTAPAPAAPAAPAAQTPSATPGAAAPATPPSATPGAPAPGAGAATPAPDAPAPESAMQLIDVPARPAAILPGRSSWDEGYPALLASFSKLATEIEKAGLKPAGRPFAVFLETDDAGFRFEAMVPVLDIPAGKDKLTTDIRLGKSPAGKAYKFQHRSAYDDIDSTYEAITAYLDEKGLEAQNLFIEEYLTTPKDSDDTSLEVDIYVFVK